MPPVHATNGGDNIANQFLYLSTPEAVAFPVTITDGAGTPIPGSPFMLSNANPVTINLGGAPPSEVTTVVQDLNTELPDRGLILLANNVFYANIRLDFFIKREVLLLKVHLA